MSFPARHEAKKLYVQREFENCCTCTSATLMVLNNAFNSAFMLYRNCWHLNVWGFSVLQVGKSVVIDSCEKCTCSSEKDPKTNANIIHCERVQCETSCPLVSSGSLGCPLNLQQD